MPIEVTAKGIQNFSGVINTVSAHRDQVKVHVTEPVKMRQELPSSLNPASASERVDTKGNARDSIEKNVEELNSHIQNLQRDLQFSVDADSGRTIIRVIDRETKETIRTIPPEDISVMAQALERHSGVFFNASV